VVLLGLYRSLLFFVALQRGATAVHDTVAGCVLHAPLAFFHTNPTGRILNRFSSDQVGPAPASCWARSPAAGSGAGGRCVLISRPAAQPGQPAAGPRGLPPLHSAPASPSLLQGRLDQDLPSAAFDVLQLGLMCAAAFVLLAIALPYILPLFLPLALLFLWLRRTYLASSREVKRWKATTRWARAHLAAAGPWACLACAARQCWCQSWHPAARRHAMHSAQGGHKPPRRQPRRSLPFLSERLSPPPRPPPWRAAAGRPCTPASPPPSGGWPP
jgi:hypothetical protein